MTWICRFAFYSSQLAARVATASATHRNEWHAAGSSGHGTVPITPEVPQSVLQHVGFASLGCPT